MRDEDGESKLADEDGGSKQVNEVVIKAGNATKTKGFEEREACLESLPKDDPHGNVAAMWDRLHKDIEDDIKDATKKPPGT